MERMLVPLILIGLGVIVADRIIFRALKRRMQQRPPSKRKTILAFSVWGVMLAACGACLFLLPPDKIWVSMTLLVAGHFSWKLIMM